MRSILIVATPYAYFDIFVHNMYTYIYTHIHIYTFTYKHVNIEIFILTCANF